MEDETGKVINPQSLVTEEHVRNVLLADKGSNVQLASWNVINFTKMGDNYACTVLGVEVKYLINAEGLEAFYVVKLNPQREADSTNQMIHEIFIKEANFYLKFRPELDQVMESIGQPPLNFPQCYYSSLEIDREQIYFEDLRKRGFKMFDRKKGMDVPHASLVLRELARLHSASLLLQAKYSEPLEVKHDYLAKDLFSGTEFSKDIVYPMIVGNLTHTVKMLEIIGGYEKAISWVESLKPQVQDIFSTEMKNGKYDVICHGDCWNNNVLFRYDSDGNPLEVMLVDLQVCRRASPATDLNYFMYTSLTSDVRRPNLKAFLDSYHNYFKEVMDAGGLAMPFSEEGIMEEFRAKNKLGAMFGMMCIPMLLMEPEEVSDIDKGSGDFVELMQEMNKKAMTMLDSNPLMKPRFLSTFDELEETGLIK